MSQENVELTRRAFDALDRRDLDEFVAFHDPSCEIKPLLAAVAGDYHGCAGVREWLDDLFGAFPDFTIPPRRCSRGWRPDTWPRTRISAHGAHGMDSAVPMIDQLSWSAVRDPITAEVILVGHLPYRARGPRSRGAAGVGDVAGERGDRGEALERVLESGQAGIGAGDPPPGLRVAPRVVPESGRDAAKRMPRVHDDWLESLDLELP